MGAETPAGGAFAEALGETDARTALVAATADPDAAFRVQRLARRLGAELSQAIDGTNEMAVRVMVRQVAKALGGLDLTVYAASLGEDAAALAVRFAAREMARGSGGSLIVVGPPPGAEGVVSVPLPEQPAAAWARAALDSLP